jgi:hypothetical protein
MLQNFLAKHKDSKQEIQISPPPLTQEKTMTSEVTITKDPDLGLWECQLTIQLPTITVTRHKKDKSDFRYEMSRAVTDVVEQIVEGLIEDEC